jgi:hypothetical protein
MKKIIATIVCTLCTIVICAQLVWLSLDKQPSPGTYSRNFHQLFTALQNQAALAYIPAVTAGVSTERRFMLDAISRHTAALAIPVHHGAFGLNYQQSGYSAFREQVLGLAYGRKLGPRVSIGMQIDYLSKVIPLYATASTITFELGCILHLTSQLHAGLHAFNPGSNRFIRLDHEQIPAIYSAGLGYEVSTAFLVSVAVIQETAIAPATKVMCEYRIIPQLSLQLGICTVPQLNSAAIGLTLQQLYLQLSTNYHPQLGISPAISIIWQLKQPQ